MVNLNLPQISKTVKLVSFFNLSLLVVDWIFLYFASRQIREIYESLGLDAIYNIGVFNVQVRSGIVLLATSAALFKFWSIEGKRVGKVERIILAIVLGLLIYATYIVLKIFFETIGRL